MVNGYSLIDENSPCWVDTSYTKAYLRHLIKSGEYLGIQIATIHNLSFYLRLMKEARHVLLTVLSLGRIRWLNS